MHFFCNRFTGCCGCHDPGLGLFLGLVVESFVWCFSFIFIFSSFGVLVCLLSLHLPYDKYIYVMVFLRLLVILTSSFNLGISSVSWVQFSFSLSRGSHVCFPRLPFFVRLLTFPTFLQPVVDLVYSPNGLCWSLFCFWFSFHPSVFGSKTLHFMMAAGLIGTKWTDVHISGCSP